MVVTRIVNTIPGEEVQNALPIRPEKFGALAVRKRHVHLQDVQQPHPLRVYGVGIELFARDESWHGQRACPFPLDGVMDSSTNALEQMLGCQTSLRGWKIGINRRKGRRLVQGPRWRSVRSFGVRQLAAAFLPASAREFQPGM